MSGVETEEFQLEIVDFGASYAFEASEGGNLCACGCACGGCAGPCCACFATEEVYDL